MGRRPLLQPPVRVSVELADFPFLQQRHTALQSLRAAPVPYATSEPKRHPLDRAGEVARSGGGLSSGWPQAHAEPLSEYCIQERWFPKGHGFTKEFTDLRPRSTGL